MMTMRKMRKLVSAFILSACMVIALVPGLSVINNPVEAQAAAKISAKSKTLFIGESFTLKVTGAKNIKWSSNKKVVASVSKKGKVTAKAAGVAKITAKYGKKKLTCTVTVRNRRKFDPADYQSYELATQIESRLDRTKYGMVAEFKNISRSTLTFNVTIIYYKNGKQVDSDTSTALTLTKGMQTVLLFKCPDDYDDCNLIYSKAAAYVNESVLGKVSVNNFTVSGNDSVTAEVKNRSNSEISHASIALVIYDNAGNPVYCQVQNAQKIPAGATVKVTYDALWYVDNATIAAKNYSFFVQTVETGL